MALTIVWVIGPPSSGKSSTIRQFTADHLKYEKNVRGDVLGVLPMPQRNYAVGVNGYGDNRKVVREGLAFLDSHRGLKVLIVASHSEGSITYKEVKRFVKRKNATFHCICTNKLAGRAKQKAKIRANVEKIMSIMPGRDRLDN